MCIRDRAGGLQRLMLTHIPSWNDPAVCRDQAASVWGLSLIHIFVVTHEMGFAREVADRVVFMDGGVVVEQGPPKEVIGNPQHERTRTFLARMRDDPATDGDQALSL